MSTSQNNKECILLAGIVDERGEVSVSFASMMMRMQQQLVTMPNAPKIIFEFFLSVKKALAFARENESVTHVIVVHGDMGLLTLDFLFQRYEDDICLATYPLRQVNWARVYELKQQGVTDASVLERESYSYNFDTTDEVQVNRDKTIRLHASGAPQAKIAKIARAAFDLFESQYDEQTRTFHGPCSVDVTTEVINSGPYDFVGTVMTSILKT